MTNSSPDISFITICYNGFKDTCELIESLHKKLKSVSYEIIVVDNASREDEAAKIHELYPTVISIRSNENGGFSGGNNIGIRLSLIHILHIDNITYSTFIAFIISLLITAINYPLIIFCKKHIPLLLGKIRIPK